MPKDSIGSENVPDFEKLTINLTPVDLGRIELLVEQGYYTNRAEFIRVAIHDELAKHAGDVDDVAKRNSLIIGALVYTRRGLEEIVRRGERVRIRAVGLVSIADDVTSELAREAIESVAVHGIFRASAAVKDALRDRTE